MEEEILKYLASKIHVFKVEPSLVGGVSYTAKLVLSVTASLHGLTGITKEQDMEVREAAKGALIKAIRDKAPTIDIWGGDEDGKAS